MPTQAEYSQAILKAQLINATDGNDLILCEMSGCDANWSKALCQFRQIQGALFCYEIGDYTSDTAVYFYNTLLEMVGLKYPAGVTPDPDAQVPSIVIITEGSTVNTTTIPFTDQTTITLADYVNTYSVMYGRTPLICQIYVDNGSNPASPDFGTAPVINFVISGDPTSGYADVTWGYGVPTTGYILLSGVQGS